MFRISLILSVLVAVPACTGSKLNEAEWKAAGAEAVLPLKQSLKGALVSGLEDGPVAAISTCRVEAPKLAAEASLGAVKVGRASGKLRNPSNVAKPWMQSILDVYETDPERREPAVVAIDKNTVGYAEPIFMQPLCVTCHGATLAPDLQTKLAELYPTDQATGYAAGDFRGIFWAELPRN